MPNRTIHVVLVEDNPDGARLVPKFVNELFSIRLYWKNVEKLKMAKELLHGENFDVVLLEGPCVSFPTDDHEEEASLDGGVESDGLWSLVAGLLRGSMTDIEHTRVDEILSPREREAISLIAKGHTNKEIAKHLSVSVRTVERYCSGILNKLGLQNRAELVAYAVQRGIPNKNA